MSNQLFQVLSNKERITPGIIRDIPQPSLDDKDFSQDGRIPKGGFLEILRKNISKIDSASDNSYNLTGLGAIAANRNFSTGNHQDILGELFNIHQSLNNFSGNEPGIHNDSWNGDFMQIKDETHSEIEPGKKSAPQNGQGQEIHEALTELEEKEQRIREELQEKMLEKLHLLLVRLRDINSSADKSNPAKLPEKDELKNALGNLETSLKELIEKLNKLNPDKKGKQNLAPPEAKEFQAKLQIIIGKMMRETDARALSDEKINSLLKSLHSLTENSAWKELVTGVKEKQAQATEKSNLKQDRSLSGNKEVQASVKWEETFSSRDKRTEGFRDARDERSAARETARVQGHKTSSNVVPNMEKSGNSDFKKFFSGEEKNQAELKSHKGEIDAFMQKSRMDTKSLSKNPAPGLKNLSNRDIQRVIEQIVQKSKLFQRGNSRYRFTANLKPQWLGKVTVQVDYDHGKMMGKFLVETSELKEILKANLGALKKELAGAGVDLQDFEVVLREDEHKSFLAFGEKKSANFREEIMPQGLYTENIELREESGVRLAMDKKAFDMRA